MIMDQKPKVMRIDERQCERGREHSSTSTGMVLERSDISTGVVPGGMERKGTEKDMEGSGVETATGHSPSALLGGESIQENRTAMRADWCPPAHVVERLKQKAIPEQFITEALETFRMYHMEKGHLMDTWATKALQWVLSDWMKKGGQWKQSEKAEFTSGSATLQRLSDTSWA